MGTLEDAQDYYWEKYLLPHMEEMTDEQIQWFLGDISGTSKDVILNSMYNSTRVRHPPKDRDAAAEYGIVRDGRFNNFRDRMLAYAQTRGAKATEAEYEQAIEEVSEEAVAEEAGYAAEEQAPQGIPFVDNAVARVRGAYETVRRAVMTPLERYRRRQQR